MKNKLKIIIPTVIAVMAIIIAALCINFTPQERADVSSIMSTAQKYLIENQYEQAIAEFNKVIEIEPKNVDAYLGLAEAYDGLGNHTMAEKMRDIATGIMSDNAVVREGELSQINIDEKAFKNDMDEYDESGVLRHKFDFYSYPDVISHEYFYNDGSILIKEILYNEHGSITEIREYDINGFLLYKNIYNYENDHITLSLTEEYEYYANSNNKKIRRWLRKGTTIEDEWTYDEDGVEIQSKRYDDGGNLNQVRDCKNINGKSVEIKWTDYWEDHITGETFFNDDGLVTGRISYYDDGSVSHKAEYEIQNGKSLEKNATAYTENGNLLMTIDTENVNGERVSSVYRNYYADDSIEFERFSNSEGKKVKEVKYHENGNIKETTDFNAQGEKSIKKQSVFYKENGELSHTIYYDENGKRIN